MWYIVWFLGVLLACSLSIINGLWLEHNEANELAEKEKDENDN